MSGPAERPAKCPQSACVLRWVTGLWGSLGRTASTSRPEWACGPWMGHQALFPHRRLDRVELARLGTGSAAGTLLRRSRPLQGSPDLKTA